jgi:hypothetical protein
MHHQRLHKGNGILLFSKYCSAGEIFQTSLFDEKLFCLGRNPKLQNGVLLKDWRDEAAHGKPSGITDNEAYTSLAMLLRFAQFVNDNWNTLVNP